MVQLLSGQFFTALFYSVSADILELYVFLRSLQHKLYQGVKPNSNMKMMIQYNNPAENERTLIVSHVAENVVSVMKI